MPLSRSANPAQGKRATAGRRKVIVGTNGLGTHPRDFEHFRAMDPLRQRTTIRDGMEALIVERMARELLHMPLQGLLSSLGLPSSTILRKIANHQRLSSAESDRVARVLYMLDQAKDVFEDEALAAEWLLRPHVELGGLKPLEVLDSQPGYDRVRDLLLRAMFGVAA